MTLFEVWMDIKPLIQRLKTFKSIYYSLVSLIKKSKFDKKAIKGIFIRYVLNAKEHRIYNLETKQIFVSRDATFYENSC